MGPLCCLPVGRILAVSPLPLPQGDRAVRPPPAAQRHLPWGSPGAAPWAAQPQPRGAAGGDSASAGSRPEPKMQL